FYSPLFLLLFTPTLLSVFNNARRSREIFPMLFLITLMLPFLFLINLLIANSMEEIRWRGRTYRLQKQKT
ncbi:MAG TPA: glycosyltransferase family 2 protein, partial [Thermoplasmataceae archaeon]|nr:glycosyltransferase family 2 protein [Thermoplasmataceae archaeon]